MTKKTRRRYSDEFKAEAVNMVRGEGYAISEATRSEHHRAPRCRRQVVADPAEGATEADHTKLTLQRELSSSLVYGGKSRG